MRVCVVSRTAALVAALVVPSLSAADDPAARGFDPDPHRYALGLDADFMVETARVHPKGSLRGELLVDYTHGLLVATTGGTNPINIIDARLTLHALASYSLGFVELGADLPFVAKQWASLTPLLAANVTPPNPLVAPIAGTTLGDFRLAGKIALLNERSHPLGLATMLEVRLPTGDKQAFTSDGLAAVPGVVATRHFGPVRVDAQLGYLFRKTGQYLQLVAPDGLTFGLGGSLALPSTRQAQEWRAIAELTGQWPRGDITTDRYRMPLSARVGIRGRLWRNLGFDLGAGKGLGTAGYGREGYRIFAGVRWDDVRPEPVPGDRDGDGVPDAEDRCPDEPGPKELEGCPDRDGDGVPDIDDKCPDEPGPAQNDGCPGEAKVEIETQRLSLKDAINFDTGKDVIRSESHPILDAVATILLSHPELRRVRVEGHTDNVGSATYNLDLSQRRAQSVVRYLVGRGVPHERLLSKGYGYDKPVASNATALGRAKNRRVEFTILEESGKGKEKAGK
jgi:OOP family OmpA-OmpF porin